MIRTDETWHRLREWTYGQAPSERLAAQVLLDDGFTGVDPRHPLGGRNGGQDALASRDDHAWLVAVYFPRGQQTFGRIKAKLLSDGARVAEHDAIGIVFVTNQELSLGERRRLREAAAAPLELMHLERITAILDQPRMYGVRAQFLKIAAPVGIGADGSSQTLEPREAEQLEIEFRGALEGEFGFLSTRGLPRDLRRGEPHLAMAQVFVPLRVAPPVDMRIVRDALERLSYQQRRVLELRLGLGGEISRTLDEVALGLVDVLGVREAQVVELRRRRREPLARERPWPARRSRTGRAGARAQRPSPHVSTGSGTVVPVRE